MSSNKNETRINILNATWQLMEQRQGQGVSMSNIAKKAGVSRQALYLHFDSRAELMIATVQYVDDIKGLNERLKLFHDAKTGIELLEACVDLWGSYIPEIYGLAKALLKTRDTDKDTNVAWNGCMAGLRDVCKKTIEELDKEGLLSSGWTKKEAIEMFWTIISIQTWEQLTIECKWTNEQYIQRIKTLLKRTFID